MSLEDVTYDLQRPKEWLGGLIFASPHSGRCYPDWFLAESRLDAQNLRSSEDAFVDRLIQPALDHGAVTLTSRVPRSMVDLNRSPDEMDPLVVSGAVPRNMSPQIMAGLGVIPVSCRRGVRFTTAPSRAKRPTCAFPSCGIPITTP